MKPGATVLTVMLREATSWASDLRHADDAGLGGGVVGLPRIAGDADHRGDRDDAAEALLHHPAQHRAGQVERRREVDRQDLVPLLVLHPHEEVVAGHAGIVDEDIEPAQRRLGGRHELVDRVVVADRLHGRIGWLPAAHLLGRILERRDTRAAQRHRGAGRASALAISRADTARSAGHQRAFAGQIKHLAAPLQKLSQATAPRRAHRYRRAFTAVACASGGCVGGEAGQDLTGSQLIDS